MQDRSIHPNTRILIDAWRRMSRGPDTNAVDDPRVAEHPDLITQLFVVQHGKDDGWRFRTAGQGLSGGRGETLAGQRVEVEITLMPLVRPGGQTDTPRLLGLYQTLGGEPMLKGRPIWRHRISMLVPPDTRIEGPQLRLVATNA